LQKLEGTKQTDNIMNHLEKTAIKYGLGTSVALAAYFLLMYQLGLAHNVELRIFNAIFMFSGIFLSVRSYKNAKGDKFEFLSGFGVGLATSVVVGVSFCLFVAAFLGLNPEFLASIKANELQGTYINTVGLVVLIFIEATASGILFTYMSMQWLKSRNMADLTSL
jgi:hypothetical protein